MNKYAALDLGTNTFHILISSFSEDGQLVEHYRQREYILLAKDGIEFINEATTARAIACIQSFAAALSLHEIAGVSVSGTAALRTASNGGELVEKMEKILGFHVNVIDGLTEAKLIYQGVSLAIPETKGGNHLIMDIGGGSVEFIVIKNGHFHYSNSYPIGIAVLKREYHHSEPIARDEVMVINQFIRDHIAKLTYTCKGMRFASLIGASGSFEVLAGMGSGRGDDLSADISTSDFEDMYDSLMGLNMEERLAREDIPDDRATLIVVAFQLMHFVLTQIRCEKITVSKYAMKEGMIANLACPKY